MIPPAVSILMRTATDDSFMAPTYAILNEFGISYETAALLKERNTAHVREYLADATERGVQVFIAAAQHSSALPTVIASNTVRPVISLSPLTETTHGLDAILSIVQVPTPIPIASVGTGTHAPRNAALLAASILALNDEELLKRLLAFRRVHEHRARRLDGGHQ